MFMIPRKNEFDLLEDMFDDPFFTRRENKLMSTDIEEKDDSYVIDIDLPGYSKENIKIKVEDGYLTVNAKTSSSNDENKKGRYVRKERYFGECSRSFYVGEEIETEDVKAKFKDGILELVVPKKEEKKELKEAKYVQIDE